MLQHFRILPFGVGLALGALLLFFYTPGPLVQILYPHPSNVNERIYKDKNGVCYKYTAEEVGCDANEGTLREYPLQG
jgi:hypothetical protein